MLSAAFDFGLAARDFGDKFVAAYGQETGEQLRPMSYLLDTFADMVVGDLTFDVDGDAATCMPPESDVSVALVRIDGVWYVVMPVDEILSGDELDSAVAAMEGMTDAVAGVAELIGADDVTAEQIEEELDQALSAALHAPLAAYVARQEALASYPVADTPQQALANLRQACIAGDKAEFLACFDTTGDGARLLSAAFDYGLVAIELREKLVEKFGQEEVEGFFILATDAVSEYSKMIDGKLTIAEDGKTATCTPADGNIYEEPSNLVLNGDVWLVTVPDMATEAVEESLTLMRAMEGGFRSMMDRVDDEGVTFEQIKEEMQEAIEAAL